jgi:hypothetical protein
MANSVASGKLEKAKLISQESDTIEFMFNPNELVFQRSIQVNASKGARTKTGLPKVSFAYPEPYTLTITNIVFDTYEDGSNVMDKYINKLRKSVEFATKGVAKINVLPFMCLLGDNSNIFVVLCSNLLID